MVIKFRRYILLVLFGLIMMGNAQAKSKPGEPSKQCTTFEKGGFTGNPNELFVRNNCDFAISISWCTEKNKKNVMM